MPMDSNPETRKMEIGQDTLKHLNTLRKWTMFLAVIGFIFLGLIIILGLITGTFLTAFNISEKAPGIPDALVLASFIGLALITFFPVFFLFRFSKLTYSAISKYDPKEMHRAIKSLKRFFLYISILLILTILIYIIALILDTTSLSFLMGF
jgi:hypothetical protein